MCSIGEGDYGDEGAAHSMPLNQDQDWIPGAICKKCNTDPVVLKLDCKEPQCRSCYLVYVHHKFRAALGSSRVLPRDADVLLVVDGSAKSIVLLDMCRFALQLDKFRKLRFNPKILFLDEQPLMDRATSQRCIDIIKTYSFEMFYQSLGSPVDPVPITDQLNIDAYSDDRLEFKATFDTLASLTSKQDFLLQLRKSVWRSAARVLKCGLVFIAETNSDLAKTLLTDISLGRGASAAHDVSFVDDRSGHVKLVRPIRDLNEKEIEHYLALNDLEYVEEVGLYGETSGGSSIQNLTNDFVRNLQKNYSATITTVFRTGDKMTPKVAGLGGQCRICHSCLDTVGSETLYATKLSSYLSSHPVDTGFDAETVTVDEKIDGSDLCHACLSISRDTSGAKDFIFAFD